MSLSEAACPPRSLPLCRPHQRLGRLSSPGVSFAGASGGSDWQQPDARAAEPCSGSCPWSVPRPLPSEPSPFPRPGRFPSPCISDARGSSEAHPCAWPTLGSVSCGSTSSPSAPGLRPLGVTAASRARLRSWYTLPVDGRSASVLGLPSPRRRPHRRDQLCLGRCWARARPRGRSEWFSCLCVLPGSWSLWVEAGAGRWPGYRPRCSSALRPAWLFAWPLHPRGVERVQLWPLRPAVASLGSAVVSGALRAPA